MHTYFDLLDALGSYAQRRGVSANRSQLRQAAQESLTRVASSHPWQCYEGSYTIYTTGPQDSATVDLDVSASTATITSGTWPAWASQGVLLLNGRSYYFPTLTSSTVLTLDGGMPADDLTDESYVLARAEYSLPSNCREVVNVSLDSQNMINVSDRQWQGLLDENMTTGQTESFAVFRDTFGQMSIRLYAAPADEYKLLIRYRQDPAEAEVSGYESYSRVGSIAISGTTVTGTATAFNSMHEGAYLLTSATANLPDNENSDNPAVTSTLIKTVSSGTVLELAVDPGDGAGLRYRITDRVDVPGHLWAPVLRYGEWSLVRQTDNATGKEERAYDDAMNAARRSERPVRTRVIIGRRTNPW